MGMIPISELVRNASGAHTRSSKANLPWHIFILFFFAISITAMRVIPSRHPQSRHYFPIPQRIHYIAVASSSLRLTHSTLSHGTYLAAANVKISTTHKLLSDDLHYFYFHSHTLPSHNRCQKRFSNASSKNSNCRISSRFRKRKCGQGGRARVVKGKKFAGRKAKCHGSPHHY